MPTHRASDGAGAGGVADGIEREHGLRDPPAAQLGAAARAIARLLPRQGLGQPRREPPELLQPSGMTRVDRASAGTAADDAALEAAMIGGIEVIARSQPYRWAAFQQGTRSRLSQAGIGRGMDLRVLHAP